MSTFVNDAESSVPQAATRRGLRFLAPAVTTALIATIGPLAGSASAAVPGLVRISATSVSNSINKSVTATCPVGKKVVGTGAELSGATGRVVIDDITPNSALTSVTATGFEDHNNFLGNWTVTAYAVCAVAPAGLVRVVASNPAPGVAANSNSPKSVTAACPAGKQMLGTGADITGGLGEVTIDDLRPNGSTVVAPTNVFVTAYEGHTGTANLWSVNAYAICAFPVAGLVRASVTSSSASPNPPLAGSATALCPGAKKATGGGAEIFGGTGHVVLDDLRPNGSSVVAPTSVAATAYEEVHLLATNWTITSYAICVTP